MRFNVLVPLALILCSCSKSSDQTGAAKPSDSVVAQAADSLAVPPPPQAADSVGKKTSPGTPAAVAASGSRMCGVKGQPVLRDVGIGDLVVGRTVSAVKQSCTVTRDASQPGNEGMAERVLTLPIGEDKIRATVVGDLIWRINVDSPRIATSDGLRVGTPMSRLLSENGVRNMEGEDGLYLIVPSHCGLSFRFGVQSRSPSGRPWTTAELVARHGKAQVNRILVTRCVK